VVIIQDSKTLSGIHKHHCLNLIQMPDSGMNSIDYFTFGNTPF